MLRFVVAAVLSVTIISLSASAQAVTPVRVANEAQEMAKAPDYITVSFENTPLQEAIYTISKRSGQTVLFVSNLLPAKKVTYRGDNVTPLAALRAVLNGTGIRADRKANGTFALVKIGSDRGGLAQGTIVGKVTDAKTGKGISGATVSVEGDARGNVTREDGSYRLVGIPAGVHTLSIRLVGYAKQTRQVTVGEGATVSSDFRLEPSTNVLDQIVVTGTVAQTELKAVPNAMTVITAKQIEERGITRIDQLFRGDVPGLFALNIGSFSPLDSIAMFSRGATRFDNGNVASDPIKTYVDGVELADPKYLSQIDPASIERIEILTGPQASTVYGSNAINGVMQIFTKRGRATRPDMTLNLTSGVAQNNLNHLLAPSHLADTRVSGVEGRLSYSVGASWNYIGAWTPGKRTERLSGSIGARMDGNKLTADASVRNGKSRNRAWGRTSQANVVLIQSGVYMFNQGNFTDPPTTSTLDGETYSLGVGYAPVSWWSNDLTVGSDVSNTETVITATEHASPFDTLLSINQSFNTRTSQRYVTTMRIPMLSLANLALTTGADHSRLNSSGAGASTPYLTGTLLNPRVTRNKPDKNTGAFVQGQLAFKDALFVTYGVRAEWNPNIGDKARVLPGRYGMSYTRDVGALSVKLRGSYGRSIRPPSGGLKLGIPVTSANFIEHFGPFDSQLSNPELLPEYQQGGEGGIELYAGNRGSFVVTRYNQTVDELIRSVPGVDSVRGLQPGVATSIPSPCLASQLRADNYCYSLQSQNLNVGSLRNQGWELQGTLNSGPISTRGTYSWTKSRVVGITERYKSKLTSSIYKTGSPFTFLPEHTWALNIAYNRASSSVSLNFNGTGALYRSGTELQAVTNLFALRITTNPVRAQSVDTKFMAPGYIMSDLNATHRFSSRVEALLQIQNLTDKYQNDVHPSYTTIGRQTKAGFRIRR